jgi:hypothetical protein
MGKEQFLNKLREEFYIGCAGVTIWEGHANEEMGSRRREVYELNGDKIAHYVCDPKTAHANSGAKWFLKGRYSKGF